MFVLLHSDNRTDKGLLHDFNGNYTSYFKWKKHF